MLLMRASKMARPQVVLDRLGILPHEHPTNLLRALFLVYLVDWKASLERGKQVTNVQWRKASWGPFSQDVLSALAHLRSDVARGEPNEELAAEERNIIDDLRQRWTDRDINELNRLVMSTYPMVVEGAEEPLNLPSLAAVYRRDFKNERARVLA
jgi:hypothetical protein